MSVLEKVINGWTDNITNDSYISVIDKKPMLRRTIKIYTLLLTTDRKIIDIGEEVLEKVLNTTERDFFQYFLIVIKNILEMNEEEIKKRFTDDFDEVKERMTFRIELYKHGWNVDQIETYIYKYILKNEKPYIDEFIHKNYYHNMMVYLGINNSKNDKKKGRPKLPITLENYIKKKHSDKVRDNMREKYKKQSMFDTIKNNLLTIDEIRLIESKFEDSDNPVLSKVRNLYFREV